MLPTMILPTTLPEPVMRSHTFNSVSVSRTSWARAAGLTIDLLQALATAPVTLWQRWSMSRRRALEFRMLRELDPRVLRDIGISHDAMGEVEVWREQQAVLRDSAYHMQ
jgi:uncharacterized protein YjiS (DUF1127 family)